MNTATKKIYINDNMTRQRYKQRKYRKITAKFQNFEKSKKTSRTLYRYHIHRVEARYAAGNPKNGTRHKVPQNKEKFPEPDKLEIFFEKCAKNVV